MASDHPVTLSDGQVNLEPFVAQPARSAASRSWRVQRLSTGADLGAIHLIDDEGPVIRSRLEIEVDAGADTATINAMAQAVHVACRWAFAALRPTVITWLAPTDPAARAVVHQAGFRVHPLPLRAAVTVAGAPHDAWYADLLPDDAVEPSRRPLTAREHHVLAGMARGRSNQQIAIDLGISENTVKNHVRSVLEMLQAPSRTAAVVEALRTGLVSIDFDRP